jgi:prevent-host-death family protein
MHQAKPQKLPRTAHSSLEEELEESSVTSARQGLLPLIEQMQKNPAMRVLIRKHGKPRAVLMSAEAYEALKKLANLTVEKAEALSQEERVEAAYQRLQNERPLTVEVATSAPITFLKKEDAKVLLGEIQEKLRELDTALEL